MPVQASHAKNSGQKLCLSDLDINENDVVLVADAIKGCDPEKLLDVISTFDTDGIFAVIELDKSIRKVFVKRITTLLDAMGKLEPEESDVKEVIVPMRGIKVIPNSAKRDHIGAGLLNISSGNNGCCMLKDLESKLIEPPWTRVLGSSIWLPPSLTERERYLTIGYVFWIMASSGLGANVE